MSNEFDIPCPTADENIWRTKAAAWLHDPGEKQLILFRRGHETGNVKRLRELLLGGQKDFFKEADHWAAAADRPQFDFKDSKSANVRFWRKAELVHPLAGLRYPLGEIAQSEEDLDRLEDEVFGSAVHILQRVLGEELAVNGADDVRRALLALWRFLPEKAFAPQGLGHLWRLLPADSRVPDHSIWTHLDLTSAIAGAFAADEEERLALLVVSIGPVQEFIAQARSTSDLWAGSHLLSHLALEAMKPLLCRFGPDAVIFPHLRGVPQVDAWLVEQGIPAELFDSIDADWRREKTDFNPLFVATLPNLFVSIVPQSQAEELAREAAKAAREALRTLALDDVMNSLLDAAGIDDVPEVMIEQIKEQLRDFPEVHWAAVPWARRGESMEQARPELEKLLRLLTGAEKQKNPGIFGQAFWKAFEKGFNANIFKYEPNAGLLYPAVYSALTRVQAAAKSVRPFEQTAQEGFRCTLCGEREWLTIDRTHLHWTAAQRQNNADQDNPTLWWRIIKGKGRKSWVRRGDHLCAICASKRLWPNIFTDRIRGKRNDTENAEPLVKDSQFSRRFVVSTHTLALADDMRKLLEAEASKKTLGNFRATYEALTENNNNKWEEWENNKWEEWEKIETTALPRRLMNLANEKLDPKRKGSKESKEAIETLKKIPALLDDLRNPSDRQGRDEEALQKLLKALKWKEHERYYALLLMDGDRMGAWLAAEDKAEQYLLPVKERLHSKVVDDAENAAATDGRVRKYLESTCPPSPARHVSISSALNGFALDLVRIVVEELCNGKIIYAGGDDVMAMLTVEDALKATTALRFLYSGFLPEGAENLLPADFSKHFEVRDGFVLYTPPNRSPEEGRRLYMTMGPKATASAGLVIAHYLMPLSRALKEMRQTEKAAKDAGRNALAVRVIKRSGTVATATGKWPKLEVKAEGVEEKTPLAQSFPGLLSRFAQAVRDGKISRRVAYHTYQHIERLPDRKLSGLETESWNAMLEAMLVHQFKQQAQKKEYHGEATRLAIDIAAWVCAQEKPLHALREFFGVAEFLGRREGDGNKDKDGDENAPGQQEGRAA